MLGLQAALAHGYTTYAITDHDASLGIVRGLTPQRLAEQRAEIDQARKDLGSSLRLLQGIEVDILSDGSLALPDDVLAGLDLVIASLHINLRQPREVITRRLLNAIRNPHVDIIGHPTGRLIGEREGADLNMEAVFTAARASGTALELNANPSRLDLNDVYARRAKELGIPISINTDAHAPDQYQLLFYGIAAARRAWLEPGDVINCWEPGRLLEWLNNRGA